MFFYSYLHHLSLSYTWTYLAYMHIIEQYHGLPYIMWIHQAIALRLVGMAFEITLNERIKNETHEQKNQSSKSLFDDLENSIPEEPKAIEIIAYAYFFIGLHKGKWHFQLTLPVNQTYLRSLRKIWISYSKLLLFFTLVVKTIFLIAVVVQASSSLAEFNFSFQESRYDSLFLYKACKSCIDPTNS